MLNIEIKFQNLVLNTLFLFFFSFFFVIGFIRMDAELLIFLSVFLVIFSVWNLISDFLGKLLFIKMTTYYYYFVRYYQGRIWLVYLLSQYLSVYLFSKRLPYFLKWYKIYESRFALLNDKGFNELLIEWDKLLNLYVYDTYLLILSNIWVSFYKAYIYLYIKYSLENAYFYDNSRKLTEYILLNKDLLDI